MERLGRPQRVEPGERVDVRIQVGQPDGEAEERPRSEQRILRFEDVGPRGASPIAGVDGKAPAGILRPKDEGLHVLVYRSSHSFVEIAPAGYAEFLREEGLGDIQKERERLGEADRPGTDSYARYAKAFVRVGAGAAAGFDRKVGLPLEIVPETDPYTWQRGTPVVLAVLFEGKPLADRQVQLVRIDAPHERLVARTGEDGRVRLEPKAGGAWAAFCLHQRRAAPELPEPQDDWEGFWGSLTFELAPAAGEAREESRARGG